MGEVQFSSQNNELFISSVDVAEMIEKEHKTLMRDIRKYIEYMGTELRSSSFFVEGSYTDVYNRIKPCFYLTKKGCDMVANKMTGAKGIIFTAKYVTKFEEMEQALSKPSYMIDDPIKRAEKWIAEQKEKMQLETHNLMLEQQVAEAQPKVTYYDKILASPSTLTVTQIAKDYGLSASRLNKLLHVEGVQFKQSGQWLLYSKYADKGYTKSRTHIDSTGEPRMSTKWTQKGRLFIHELLTRIGINAVEDQEN